MLINLIANAFNYCEAAAPALSLKELQRGRQLIFNLVDNGSGIPRDQQYLIFEKFSLLETKVGNVKLGMVICNKICSVWAEIFLFFRLRWRRVSGFIILL